MDKINAICFFEILGKPADHVKNSMETLIEKMNTEKGVKILNKKVQDTIPAKNSQTLFTTFAEVEFEFDTLSHLFGIVFAYMPSTVEIITPERINMSNGELNQFAAALTQRLHNYDSIAKNILMERQILFKELQEKAPELLKEIQAREKEKIKKDK